MRVEASLYVLSFALILLTPDSTITGFLAGCAWGIGLASSVARAAKDKT